MASVSFSSLRSQTNGGGVLRRIFMKRLPESAACGRTNGNDEVGCTSDTARFRVFGVCIEKLPIG